MSPRSLSDSLKQLSGSVANRRSRVEPTILLNAAFDCRQWHSQTSINGKPQSHNPDDNLETLINLLYCLQVCTRFAWLCERPRVLAKPVRMPGSRGIWHLDMAQVAGLELVEPAMMVRPYGLQRKLLAVLTRFLGHE